MKITREFYFIFFPSKLCIKKIGLILGPSDQPYKNKYRQKKKLKGKLAVSVDKIDAIPGENIKSPNLRFCWRIFLSIHHHTWLIKLSSELEVTEKQLFNCFSVNQMT